MKVESYFLHSAIKQISSTVFSSPHSGCAYEETFENDVNLKPIELRSSEDAFVDELFSEVASYGSKLLSAFAPRSFVDLNRSFTELDPELIEGVEKWDHTIKVKSGLGVIPRVVAKDKPIKNGKISLKEANRRLGQFYFPFHQKLEKILSETRAQFGQVLLIDCHSMPSDSVKDLKSFHCKSPDIVLGDCFGTSCSKELLDQVEKLFEAREFKVVRNKPFAGGFITKNYGKPNLNQQVIQVEINRSLYMNEEKIMKNKNFCEIKEKISSVAYDLVKLNSQESLLVAE